MTTPSGTEAVRKTYQSLLAAVADADGREMSTRRPARSWPARRPSAMLDDAVARAAPRSPHGRPGATRIAPALHRVADAIEPSSESLAELLSREQGKPLNGPNARFEVGACAAWLRGTADTPLPAEIVVDDGTTMPSCTTDRSAWSA